VTVTGVSSSGSTPVTLTVTCDPTGSRVSGTASVTVP
jgi:hypothetical protein